MATGLLFNPDPGPTCLGKLVPSTVFGSSNILITYRHVLLKKNVYFLSTRTGLSLRFQVAGHLLLVAGEVASRHGAPLPPKKFWKCDFYRFPKGITAPKK